MRSLGQRTKRNHAATLRGGQGRSMRSSHLVLGDLLSTLALPSRYAWFAYSQLWAQSPGIVGPSVGESEAVVDEERRKNSRGVIASRASRLDHVVAQYGIEQIDRGPRLRGSEGTARTIWRVSPIPPPAASGNSYMRVEPRFAQSPSNDCPRSGPVLETWVSPLLAGLSSGLEPAPGIDCRLRNASGGRERSFDEVPNHKERARTTAQRFVHAANRLPLSRMCKPLARSMLRA